MTDKLGTHMSTEEEKSLHYKKNYTICSDQNALGFQSMTIVYDDHHVVSRLKYHPIFSYF